MLGYAPFYNRVIRKSIVTFGSIFKDLILIKYENDYSSTETARLTVPLTYAGKENFISRLYGNLTPPKPVQIVLPAMSFELDPEIKYQSDRKLSTFQSTITQNGQQINQQYQGVPYDLTFYLYIYVRNIEDGTQLMEQIVPFFTPDYTVTVDYIPEMGITRNVPVVLDNITQSVEYQGDAKTQDRTIIWELTFTMPVTFYGPVSDSGIIKQANVNINYGLPGVITSTGMVEIFLANTGGLGEYQIGESVYQGLSLPDANVTGIVNIWDTTNFRLGLTNTNGAFITSANITGVNSGASWRIIETTNNIILAEDTAIVSPNTANISDDFIILNSWKEY